MRIALLLLSLAFLQNNPTASDAWAESGDRALLVYATINNPTMYDIYVTSASFPSAGRAELWVEDKKVTSLTVPAFGSLELKRGEARVRLFGPSEAVLKVGDHLKGTLETDGGVSIEITAIFKGSQPGVGPSR
jgi:copper(I)-binding protein